MRSLLTVLIASLIACAGTSTRSTAKDESAAERARREAKAAGEDDVSSQGKAWGGWRYTGSRDECFYVVGRKCFAELRDACKAAGCRSAKPAQCRVQGGGPASISCAK
jgi:hypothetical protein